MVAGTKLEFDLLHGGGNEVHKLAVRTQSIVSICGADIAS